MKRIVFILLIFSMFIGSGCSEKFKGSEDKVFEDPATGLNWQVTDTKKDWEGAITYCEDLDYANHQDWYLPSYRELQSIVVKTNASIAIDLVAFPQTKPAHYWSATTYESAEIMAYNIDFSNGMVLTEEKAFEKYVRCVRQGQ